MGSSYLTVLEARFLATTLHFISVLMAVFARDENVASSLPSTRTQTDLDRAMRSLTAALVLALLFFALHLLGLVGGFSVFDRVSNMTAVLLHGLGFILTSWFIVDGWHVNSYWGIWFFCSFVPAMQEIGILLKMFVLRVMEY